jgi:hypothetical protein
LKTIFAKLMPYRYFIGALLLSSLLSLYAYQHLSGREIFDYQNSTDRDPLLYAPTVLGLLVLLTPVFIINPRRRVLSIAALILAVPVAGISLWFGNGLMAASGMEWLGVILANYFFFPVAYTVVMLFGWVAVKFADWGHSKGGNWWINFLIAYLFPIVSWILIAVKKPAKSSD